MMYRLIVALILFATPVLACESRDGLPDSSPDCTPGVADPAVTQSNIHETICVPGYTATVRNVPASEKEAVFKEYGITHHAPGEWEIDHDESLELGGSNDIRNLWPQSYITPINAHQKDALENTLHRLVCDDKISLEEAQTAIRTNWIEAYRKYVCPTHQGELCKQETP